MATNSLILVFAAGMGAGTVFYGGLWWTVLKGITARQPGLLFAGSFFGRMAAVAAAIYLISGARLERLAVCMLGFFMARAVIMRRLRPLEASLEGKEHAHQP